MICNRADLDSCIDWLARENASPSSEPRTAVEVTYRGWDIRLTDEDSVGYAIFATYEQPILVAPWLVDELKRLATVHEPSVE